MTKEDLVTIIQKIKNRCGLETATKITYYWKDDKVVFKIYFDSLYLPENMRINNDNVLESFIQSNVYEYKDDFTILGLNQDEGYIEVLPEDQKFKIIKKYKDLTDTKNESYLHLADKQFNETLAKEKGFILNELTIPTEGKGSNTDLDNATDVGKGKLSSKSLKSVKADVKLIAFHNPASQAAQNHLAQMDKKDNNKAKVSAQIGTHIEGCKEKIFFGVSDLPFEQYPQTVPLLCSLIRKDLDKDTYVFAMIPSQRLNGIINNLEVEKVTEVTENAVKTMKDNNIALPIKGIADNADKIIDDSDIAKAKELAKKLVDKAEKYVKDHKGWKKMSFNTGSDLSISNSKNDKKNDETRPKVKGEKDSSELGDKFNDISSQKAPKNTSSAGAKWIQGDNWKKWVDNYNQLANEKKGKMTLAKALCEDTYKNSNIDIILTQIQNYQKKVKEIGQSLTNIGSLNEISGFKDKLKTLGSMLLNDSLKILWGEINRQREESAGVEDAKTGSMKLQGAKHMGVEVGSKATKAQGDKKDKKSNVAYMAGFPNDFDVFIANQPEFIELMNCFDAEEVNQIYAPEEYKAVENNAIEQEKENNEENPEEKSSTENNTSQESQ